MTTLDQPTLDRLVDIISQEIHNVLRQSAAAPDQTDLDSCLDCMGQCVQECPDRIKAAIQAGADRFTAQLGITQVSPEVSHLIDHTLLKPEATVQQISQLCHEAILYKFASVCVNPSHVKLAAQLLNQSDVKVCTVVGFPLGATSPEAKTFETPQALDDG
ncbi:MAG: hypothetical protein R3264_13610, partial [Anaerolineae bacterium]|nr:hypothetical protein [Anaerolineae bacterium]